MLLLFNVERQPAGLATTPKSCSTSAMANSDPSPLTMFNPSNEPVTIQKLIDNRINKMITNAISVIFVDWYLEGVRLMGTWHRMTTMRLRRRLRRPGARINWISFLTCWTWVQTNWTSTLAYSFCYCCYCVCCSMKSRSMTSNDASPVWSQSKSDLARHEHYLTCHDWHDWAAKTVSFNNSFWKKKNPKCFEGVPEPNNQTLWNTATDWDCYSTEQLKNPSPQAFLSPTRPATGQRMALFCCLAGWPGRVWAVDAFCVGSLFQSTMSKATRTAWEEANDNSVPLPAWWMRPAGPALGFVFREKNMQKASKGVTWFISASRNRSKTKRNQRLAQ